MRSLYPTEHFTLSYEEAAPTKQPEIRQELVRILADDLVRFLRTQRRH